MKPLLSLFTATLFLWTAAGHAMAEDSLMVMSFNIRYDNPNDPNPWPQRYEHVAEIIGERYPADLAGLQEALKHQIDDLLDVLPQYAYIGVGREDGRENGEYSCIFYRKDRFEVLEHDTFWLSTTPDTPGSKSWDSSLPRIVTWGKFQEIDTGKVLYHFNTHFDHRGQQARIKSAKLIWRKIKQITGHTPTVLTGDFNMRETSQPYKILSGRVFLDGGTTDLADARYASMNVHQGPTSSFTNWKEPGEPESMIDYIFVRNGFRVINHITVDDKFDGFFPSDHLPVTAELKWPEE